MIPDRRSEMLPLEIKLGGRRVYSVRKLKKYDAAGLIKVSDILYKCGKDMAEKYGLHHWDNSKLKNTAVVALCVLKNDIYLVFDENKAYVATFQVRKDGESLLFQKLATLPDFAGGGIGSFCMAEIEKIAKAENCKSVICEVYDKSEHAADFYKHRGYSVYGTAQTLKYTELKLKKEL